MGEVTGSAAQLRGHTGAASVPEGACVSEPGPWERKGQEALRESPWEIPRKQSPGTPSKGENGS